MLIAAGKLAQAQAWADENGVSPILPLSPEREYDHLTLVRLLLAQSRAESNAHHLETAKSLLNRLWAAAEPGDRKGRLIEIAMLQALVEEGRGEAAAALQPLAQALVLGEPEGYFRLFVSEGEAMLWLLRAAKSAGIARGYIDRLIGAFDPSPPESKDGAIPQVNHTLVEPLSNRELDILRLLQTELSGPEIANELTIALSTVRTHTKRIYQKLDATNRRMAVNRAIELGLI